MANIAKTRKAKPGEKRLAISVAAVDDDGNSKSYLPGTPVAELPDEFKNIEKTNPQAVTTDDDEDDDAADDGFDVTSVPLVASALEELKKDELKAVADHHGVEYKARDSAETIVGNIVTSDAATVHGERGAQ